jgi:hypothetical protein
MKITHNKCGCIESSGVKDPKCLKRRYVVEDIKRGKSIDIFICNEYLRLMLQQDKHYSWFAKKYAVHDVLKEIFKEYVHVEDFWIQRLGVSNKNDIANQYITYTLCDRPYIYSTISFLDAVEACCQNKYYGRLTYMVVDKFEDYINKNEYKKYKSKYAEAGRLVRKIGRCFSNEREMLIQELLILLLKLKTK